ncbi:hypothetical protein [Flagellimonas sp.]|uniref:hypothetical protein n=1 Tax=Flagellimonas sp. TaxID=2058762 RepID=UPI003F4A7C1E
MRYTIVINQVQCLKYSVKVSEAALMDLLNQLSSWADEKIIDGKTYYFLSRTKVMEELPYWFKKPDTVYRVFKSLEAKRMIEYRTIKKQDFLRLTTYGKRWNAFEKNSEKFPKNEDGNSEKFPNPEKNPRKPGKISEKENQPNSLDNSVVTPYVSEINPTYKYYKYTRDNSLRIVLGNIHKENPFALECILDSPTFHERIIRSLTAMGHVFDFEKHIGPILVHWVCNEFMATGLESNAQSLRQRCVGYVVKVVKNGGLENKEIKHIFEPKPSYLIDDE